MSQKKVDAYKASKATRAQRSKRENMMRKVETGIIGLVALVIVGWMGYSVVDKINGSNPEETVVTETVIDTTALDEYVGGLR